ncbi:hypothetical protein GB937_008641 [Aspergillus fischeri]|nr:hypothetical protein GB937_008641 [Aspergillus fischeri]
MSGPCNAPAKVGNIDIQCPCKRFIRRSKDGQLQLDTPCDDCYHPLGEHKDASEVDSTQIGTSQMETASIPDPYLSPRLDTVSTLANLIDDQKVVHVRGPPQGYYKVNGRRSIYLSTWSKLDQYPPSEDDTFHYAWRNLNCMLRSRFNRHKEDYLSPGTVLIIDEAQGSYSDDIFWNSIIKERLDRRGLDISFCLFCCYGSPGTGVETELDRDLRYTPARFTLAQRVTLTPQSHPSPQIGLFFTRSEFTDAAERLIASSHFQEKFTLNPDAEDYLFSLTNGHPGGLKSVLQYIHDFYRHSIKTGDVPVITREHVVDSLKRDQDVWDKLTQELISRSLPMGDRLTTEVADVLAQVLEEGNVPRFTLKEGNEPKLNPAAERCYKHGWLHRMQILRQPGYEKDVYVLPSRLHEKHMGRILHLNERTKSLPSEFDTLRYLTLAILRQFSSSNLRYSSEGKILSTGAQPKPIEAQYQDEFYRCFNKIAGRANGLGPRTVESIFTFLTKDGQWRYIYPALFTVDSTNIRVEYGETRLIHAVFEDDYKTLAILDNQGEKLQTSFLPN